MIARPVVSTKGLIKTYGRRRALDVFSLDVPAGAILGLVGPNGAGKTTWMMAVAGLLKLKAGSIDLFGTGRAFDPALQSGRLSILPQDSELPLESTPFGFLSGLARLQGLDAETAKTEANRLLNALNLADRARASIRSLSHGMRKRLMAAQCFLGNPELILLDEPLNGLDPEEAQRLRNLITSHAGERTIVISSHNLADLERLSTHIAFVREGRVTKCRAIAELAAEGESLEDVYLRTVSQSAL